MARRPLVRTVSSLATAALTVSAGLFLATSVTRPAEAAGYSETLQVLSNREEGINTAYNLIAGRAYEVVASGMYNYQVGGIAGVGRELFGGARADAECTELSPDPTWNPERWRLLDPLGDPNDLYINGQDVSWTPIQPDIMGCSSNHTYRYVLVPDVTGPANFAVHEPNKASWTDNVGLLTVQVSELAGSLDTFSIPSAAPNGGTSAITLQPNVTYRIEVSGTYNPSSSLGSNMSADAECTQTLGAPGIVEHPNSTIEKQTDMYDVRFMGQPVSWAPSTGDPSGCDDKTHTYYLDYTPSTAHQAKIAVFDTFMNDNVGSLTARITVVSTATAGAAALPSISATEQVMVPTNNPGGASNTIPLAAGQQYLIEVSGVYGWGAGGADAECSTTTLDPTWLSNRFAALPEGTGTDLLDLMVNGRIVNWTPTKGDSNGCNAIDHTYRLLYVPTSSGLVSFKIKATNYAPNFGDLKVTIFHVTETLMGVVQVATNNPNGSLTPPLLAGHKYRFVASGTWSWFTGDPLYLADAECSRRHNRDWMENQFAGETGFEKNEDLLDLAINGVVQDWMPNTGPLSAAAAHCDKNHEYTLTHLATATGPAKLSVIDTRYDENGNNMRVFVYKRLD